MSQELDDAGQLLDDLNAARNPRQSIESKVNDLLKIASAHHRHLRILSEPQPPPPSPSEEKGASDEEPSPRNPSKHPDQRDGQCGMVSHDEAKDIALAYIDKAFNNPERPGRVRIRHTIPASYRDNTDLRLCAYIDQQKHQASADAATIAGLRKEDAHAARAVELFRYMMKYAAHEDWLIWGTKKRAHQAARWVEEDQKIRASLRPEPGGGK